MKQRLENWKNKIDKRKKVEEFLGLIQEESEYIELKLTLSDALAKRRKKSNLTQAQLAKMLKSSQSRICDKYAIMRPERT